MTMVADKNCLNCDWKKTKGPHLSCYYGYTYKAWLPQKEAEMFPICEVSRSEQNSNPHIRGLKIVLRKCEWTPVIEEKH